MALRDVKGYFRKGGVFVRGHTRRGGPAANTEDRAVQERRRVSQAQEEERALGGKSGDPRLAAAHGHIASLQAEAREKAHLMSGEELMDMAQESSGVIDSTTSVIVELGGNTTPEDDCLIDAIEAAHVDIAKRVSDCLG